MMKFIGSFIVDSVDFGIGTTDGIVVLGRLGKRD
jgi:hypothetical protein